MRAVEMAQREKILLCRHSDLSSDSQHSRRKLGFVKSICSPSLQGERPEHIRGSLASWFSQSGRDSVYGDREERKRGTHLRPPHFLAQAYRTTYTCVCMCKHIKLKVYFHTIHKVNKVKRRRIFCFLLNQRHRG